MSKPSVANPVILQHRRSSGVPGLIATSSCWLASAILLLGLAACAQAPKDAKQKDLGVLVYPLPPDDPRFYYERTIRSSRDVDKSVVSSSLEELLTGRNTSAANVGLKKPYAIAVHQGRIFVSEPSGRVVKVFDAAQGKFFTIGEEDPGSLVMPIGMDIDAAGNLYVADIGASAVMVYNRDGKFLRSLAGSKIGEPPMFNRMTSVAVDKKGEKVFVVDIGGTSSSTPEQHRLRVFDAKTGKHLYDIGKRGTAPGEFNLARDVVLDKNNNLYVVDGGNFRVQVFQVTDTEAKFVREFGKLGTQIGDFARPKEIALDADGNIYVADAGFENVQLFTPEGKLLMAIGTGSNNDTPGRYKLLSGIAVDEDGRIYLVDQLNKKVEIFRPASVAEGDGYLAGKKIVDKSKQPSPNPGPLLPGQTVPDKNIPGGQDPEQVSVEPQPK